MAERVQGKEGDEEGERVEQDGDLGTAVKDRSGGSPEEVARSYLVLWALVGYRRRGKVMRGDR